MRVLGLDPGSFRTGYGIVEEVDDNFSFVSSGVIFQKGSLSSRLKGIYEGISEIIRKFSPGVIVYETPFVAKNVKSALRLGQVQGIILLCASTYQLPFYEYTPLEIKMALTGYGRAPKEQVREMVKRILKLDEVPLLDASDALAVAICYLHCRNKEL